MEQDLAKKIEFTCNKTEQEIQEEINAGKSLEEITKGLKIEGELIFDTSR